MIVRITTWAKQVLFGVGVVGVLGLFPVGYHYGVKAERADQREKYTNSLENLINSYGDTQTLLNSIAQNQQVTLSLIRTNQGKVTEGVKEYNRTDDSRIKCLDDNWVQLYNQAIQSTESVSGIKIDGKGGTKSSTEEGSR